jgi:HKD family nuclease
MLDVAMSISLQLLKTPAELLSALHELTAWATEIRMAYAWASSADGKAKHWLALPLDKLKMAVIGVHFAQTEPYALYKLRETGTLRVIPETAGVFHPKVILGTKGSEARCIIGSANFTAAAFTGNVELAVLMSGPASAPTIVDVATFIEDQWTGPWAFEPEDDWLKSYEETHANRPRPPRVRWRTKKHHQLTSVGELQVEWPEYAALIRSQERRVLSNGWEIAVYDHPNGSYLQEAEACAAYFEDNPSFGDMPLEDRKHVAGWGDLTWGHFGRMTGAGDFKKLTRVNAKQIAKHLDRIPLSGPVSRSELAAVLRGLMSLQGVALGAATRLLTVKRPDLFTSANNANRERMSKVFGRPVRTVDHYLEIHDVIRQMPWFNAPEPDDENERRLWRNRVALLDALLYDPPKD